MSTDFMHQTVTSFYQPSWWKYKQNRCCFWWQVLIITHQ